MSTSFSILVTGSPIGAQCHFTATQTIDSLLQLGHQVKCIFLYGDAVLAAAPNTGANPIAADSAYDGWIYLAQEHSLTIHCCTTVAAKRGLFESDEANRLNLDNALIEAPFSASGLATWSEALLSTDRMVHFR